MNMSTSSSSNNSSNNNGKHHHSNNFSTSFKSKSFSDPVLNKSSSVTCQKEALKMDNWLAKKRMIETFPDEDDVFGDDANCLLSVNSSKRSHMSINSLTDVNNTSNISNRSIRKVNNNNGSQKDNNNIINNNIINNNVINNSSSNCKSSNDDEKFFSGIAAKSLSSWKQISTNGSSTYSTGSINNDDDYDGCVDMNGFANNSEDYLEYMESLGNYMVPDYNYHCRQLSTITEASKETDKTELSRHVSLDGACLPFLKGNLSFQKNFLTSTTYHYDLNVCNHKVTNSSCNDNNDNKYDSINFNNNNYKHLNSNNIKNNNINNNRNNITNANNFPKTYKDTFMIDDTVNSKSRRKATNHGSISFSLMADSHASNMSEMINSVDFKGSISNTREYVHRPNDQAEVCNVYARETSSNSALNASSRLVAGKKVKGVSNRGKENRNLEIDKLQNKKNISPEDADLQKMEESIRWVDPKECERGSFDFLKLNDSHKNDDGNIDNSAYKVRADIVSGKTPTQTARPLMNADYIHDWLKASAEKNAKMASESFSLTESFNSNRAPASVDDDLSSESFKLCRRIHVMNIESIDSSLRTKYREIAPAKPPNSNVPALKQKEIVMPNLSVKVNQKFNEKSESLQKQCSNNVVPEREIMGKVDESSRQADESTHATKPQRGENQVHAVPIQKSPNTKRDIKTDNINNNNKKKKKKKKEKERESQTDSLDKTLVNSSQGTDNCFSSTPIKSSGTLTRLSSVSTIPPADDAVFDRMSSIGSLSTFANSDGLARPNSNKGSNHQYVNKKLNAPGSDVNIPDDDVIKRRRSMSTSQIDVCIPSSRLLQVPNELQFSEACCSLLSSIAYLPLINPSYSNNINNDNNNGAINGSKFKICDNPFTVKEKIIIEKKSEELVKIIFTPEEAGIYIGTLSLSLSFLSDDESVLARQQHKCSLHKHPYPSNANRMNNLNRVEENNNHNSNNNNNNDCYDGNYYSYNKINMAAQYDRVPLSVCLQAVAVKPKIEITAALTPNQLRSTSSSSSSSPNDVIDFGMVPLKTTMTQRIYISNKCRAAVPLRLMLRADNKSYNCFKFCTPPATSCLSNKFKTSVISTNLTAVNDKQMLQLVLSPSSSHENDHDDDDDDCGPRDAPDEQLIPVDIEFTPPAIDTKQLERYECRLEAQLNTINPHSPIVASKQLLAASALAKLHIESKHLILTFDKDTHQHQVQLRNVGLIALNVSANTEGMLFFVSPQKFCILPGDTLQLQVTCLLHLDINNNINSNNNNINNSSNNRIESFASEDRCATIATLFPVHSTPAIQQLHHHQQQQQLIINNIISNKIRDEDDDDDDEDGVGAVWTVKPSSVLLVANPVNG
ncbi:hypothetical protein HELRODRAFT_164551 [Helobdella robusta]|uniref:Uncharacterized protein n=1 Tax=Helobdella robusta TaxID=6412 RepID=T1EVK4_HELRO|nr:hypothetical protein HELRODRAFT_164551 [Helobdella robusta]ESN94668.1 hypothetical protein HELRODRAFT_164551 [Helobdella robusta]